MADEVPLAFEFDAHFQKLFRSLAAMESKVANDLRKIDGSFEKSNRRVTEALNRSSQSMLKFGNLTGSQRFVLQNTSAQFGDLAVQIAAGTDPMRAMSQQVPQLLGGFGALGGTLGVVAPLLGTIAAVGLPLAAVFLGMATSSEEAAAGAETLADRTKLLRDATEAYGKAAEANKANIVELRADYGSLADEIKRGLDIQEELTKAAQQRSQTLTSSGAFQEVTQGLPGLSSINAIQSVIKGYDELIRKRDQLRLQMANTVAGSAEGQQLQNELFDTERAVQQLDLISARLTRLAEIYGITTDQATRLSIAAAELNNANPGVAQAEAADRLRTILIDIFGSAAAVDERFAGMTASLDAIVESGAKAAENTWTMFDAAESLTGALGAGAAMLEGMRAQAASLVVQFQQAAKAAWDMAQARVQAQNRLDQMAIEFSPGGQALTKYGSRAPGGTAAQNALESRNTPKATGGGGGSRGGSTLSAEDMAALAKVNALLESTRTSAEKYKIELEAINRLHAAGKISAEEAARATSALNEKFRQGIFDAQEFKGALKSAFVDLVTGAEDLGDALSNLLGKLAEMAASSAFDLLFNGSGGGSGGSSGGSGGGGFFGFLKKLIGFDGGGYTGNGARSGGLDGKGGFLAMMHPQETVVDHTRGQGRGAVVMNVIVNGATGNSEIRNMVASGIKTALTGYDRRVLPGRFEAINRDGRRRN